MSDRQLALTEQIEREHLAAGLDALEQRAQLGTAQRRSRISSSVSHAAPSDSSSATVFGGCRRSACR